ncbi:MAG: helix-turn-helix domain-containing protein [Candidatus Bathyarchaeota archaeon]|nr:helix-turn-helix domain-containing protein [Candidatus Bathyarchaeota archaeon]
MTSFEVLFRARHRGALLELSERHPSMRVYTWCNRVNEVLEVEVEELSDYGAVLAEVGKMANVVGESEGGGIHLIESTCFCTPDNSVSMNVEDLPVLMVSPEVMHGGWEYYRLILFRHEDFAEVVRRLEERGWSVEVLEKSEVRGSLAGSILEADSVFSTLTGKQMDAMIRAYGHGYYRLPREADIQEIAKRERVKRTTFQEHLKKGENKIIERIIPYMRLYARRSGDAARLTASSGGRRSMNDD